jgi:hypothetical protein
MIAQFLSLVPVFASRNFDARFGGREVRCCAQADLRHDRARRHVSQVGLELSQS